MSSSRAPARDLEAGVQGGAPSTAQADERTHLLARPRDAERSSRSHHDHAHHGAGGGSGGKYESYQSINRVTSSRIIRGLSFVLGVLVAALGISIVLQTLSLPAGSHGEWRERRRKPGRNYDAFLVKGSRGAVATENGKCSQMGVDILRKGGNAVDAAVTSTLCIGLMNMFSSGIGGGGFMIVRNPTPCGDPPSNSPQAKTLTHCAEHITIDFRETAPALANQTMFSKDPMAARFGGLASGVPGEVKGLEEAWKRWGSKKPGLGWADLIEPVAQLAEQGWPISAELERRMKVMTGFLGPFLTKEPEWRQVFGTKHGKLKRAGDLMQRISYGRTLREIGEKGSDVFYHVSEADSWLNAWMGCH